MSQSNLKVGYFFLEALNAFATSYFFYYLFFYRHSRFGCGNASNLLLSALSGFVYMFAAWYGGRFGQRHGYFLALRLGFSIMAVSLALGSQLAAGIWHFPVVGFWTIGMCFCWPSLEALVSEKEGPAALQRMVGIYNVTWAGVSALAYFTGGALIKAFGMESIFWIPVGMHVLQLALLKCLEAESAAGMAVIPESSATAALDGGSRTSPRDIAPRAFQRMAWVANPFAYVAINTLVAVIPELASRLRLSIVFAGFFCSIWFFARLAAFFILWWWPGWHYRFRWLMSAYIFMVVSFLLFLLIPNFFLGIIAQIMFGFSVGLIYYSSLFYSMDVGEAKGEHGGIHEGAIGLGIFLGPAMGASAAFFAPEFADSSAWAVGALLLAGLGLILFLRSRQSRQPGKAI